MTEWQRFVRYMKAELPTRRRLVVRRRAMNDHGSTEISSTLRTITVSIRKQDPLHIQKDTLVHEYGHVLELDAWEPHGEPWSKFQAKAYRAFEKYE